MMQNVKRRYEMQNVCLKILSKDGETLAVNRGMDEVNLVYAGEYVEGDSIVVEVQEEDTYAWVQLDDALGKVLLFLKGNFQYKIPFGVRKTNLSPKAFTGRKHLLSVKVAKSFEIGMYRNLALNVYDQHEIENLFPHAVANVETRGEAVFAAQNAIDGVTANASHGEWPYASWGINRQPDATIRITFGRTVEVDRIIVYLRADFPHDNWWNQVSFVFSDGSQLEAELIKSGNAQEIVFEKKRVEWLEMCDMRQSKEASPFPALTQIEIYGNEYLS